MPKIEVGEAKGLVRIKGVDHIVLRTDSVAAMLHFYCQVLGCVEERRLQDLGLIQLRAGSALIDLVDIEGQLGKAGGGKPQQQGRNLEHFCLLIDAVNESELRQYLEQHGIASDEFAERYGATGYGNSIYIRDPQGNNVELKLDKPKQ